MSIEYCPTYKMGADYFTKPLQGKPFNFMRDVIMGYKEIKELSELKIPSIKERVGNTCKNVIEEIKNSSKCEQNSKFGNEQKIQSTYADKVRANS